MTNSPEPETPKSRWAQAAPTVIASVAASLIAAGIIALVAYVLKDPPPVQVNVELILDISDQMKEKFGKTSRFKAAVEELSEFVEPRDADNLSLWTAGGACGAQGTEEVVPFGQDNSDQIRSALDGLEPGGPANLADALVRATGAFSDPDRFPADVQKTMFVLTAGSDTCDEDYVGELETRLNEIGHGVNVKLHFFALDVSAKAKRKLKRLERKLPDQVEVQTPESPSDLGDDIEDALVATPTLTPTPTPTLTPTDPDPGETVDAQLNEWTIQPSTASVDAGEVTFEVANVGTRRHQFLVFETDLAATELPTGADGAVLEGAEGVTLVGRIEGVDPGEAIGLPLGLDPGTYVLICNLVDEDEPSNAHYQLGMRTSFTVE